VISDVPGGSSRTSWAIANYLEDNYPRLPSLFGGGAGRDLTLFVQSWTADSLHRGVIDLILLDVYSQLHESDKAYFRSTREKRFGRPLEDVQAGGKRAWRHFAPACNPCAPHSLRNPGWVAKRRFMPTISSSAPFNGRAW